jgi:hypothetical protein
MRTAYGGRGGRGGGEDEGVQHIKMKLLDPTERRF